jgi:hypothetical protein
LGQDLIGLSRLGHDQASRGLFVEPMNDPGSLYAPDGGEPGAVVKKGVDKCPPLTPGAGMNHQARRFVDHQEISVLIQDIERNRLGLDPPRLRRGECHDESVVSPNSIARLSGAVADPHALLMNQALDHRPREAT